MPVNIKGKIYILVSERVGMFHADHDKADDHRGGDLSITTEIVNQDANDKGVERFIVKATVKTRKGTFTGYAEQIRGVGMIAGTSPLEVCETSAIGRALGFAGYGVIESIASADEVIAKSETKKMADELGEADKRHAK